MDKISIQQFLLRQPSGPAETETDRFYLDIANGLLDIAGNEGLFAGWPDAVVRQAALCVVGYYQDVIADAGIWHAFVNENRRLWNRTLPFYDTGEEYIDYELNRADVRFMVWYALAMTWEDRRDLYPLDETLLAGADRWHSYLEERYDEAPVPVDYHLAHELEIHADEDQEGVMALANWLYLHCYLLTPANALTLSELMAGQDFSGEAGHVRLRESLHKAMNEFPTGPLALYLREWLYLVLEDRMPPEPRNRAEGDEHPYYSRFMKATGGRVTAYFATYEEMNRFWIEALGWEPGVEHLSVLRSSRDFAVMVNRTKGMLVARDVARNIADPDNPLYDREWACAHAFEMLSVRGACPGDLLKYVTGKGWLPDAVFPGTDDYGLVRENQDFIARCYLQQYYRGD